LLTLIFFRYLPVHNTSAASNAQTLCSHSQCDIYSHLAPYSVISLDVIFTTPEVVLINLEVIFITLERMVPFPQKTQVTVRLGLQREGSTHRAATQTAFRNSSHAIRHTASHEISLDLVAGLIVCLLLRVDEDANIAPIVNTTPVNFAAMLEGAEGRAVMMTLVEDHHPERINRAGVLSCKVLIGVIEAKDGVCRVERDLLHLAVFFIVEESRTISEQCIPSGASLSLRLVWKVVSVTLVPTLASDRGLGVRTLVENVWQIDTIREAVGTECLCHLAFTKDDLLELFKAFERSDQFWDLMITVSFHHAD
jgi:hypothetical protein